MSNGFDADVTESPMQKLARVSMDQYTQSMFAEADASFAGTTNFYPVMEASVNFTNTSVTKSNSFLDQSFCNGDDSHDAGDDDDNDRGEDTSSSMSTKKRKKSLSPCSSIEKQNQLPMFLTKTYHMVERCDPDVASWGEDGTNFVIKNVEKFAAVVLPQYFKHSNFSSFARQLNFYGFRKLKAEPILTADYDARTANYMRFFHEQFQKDRPELLQNIKRATKSDIQSKDEFYNLRVDVQNLSETIATMNAEFDMKIAQVTFDLNRKIVHLNGLYEQIRTLLLQHSAQGSLLLLQQQQQQQQQQQSQIPQSIPSQQQPQQMQQPRIQQQQQLLNQYNSSNLSALSSVPNSTQVPASSQGNIGLHSSNRSTTNTATNPVSMNQSYSMQYLHQACMTLQSPAGPQPYSHHAALLPADNVTSKGAVAKTNLSSSTTMRSGVTGIGEPNMLMATHSSSLTRKDGGPGYLRNMDIPSDDFQLPPPSLA